MLADALEVLGPCVPNLPFDVQDSTDTREEVRLKYRFLDLRNPRVHDNILFRSKVVSFLRRKMEALGFTEITTPILTCSSPEVRATISSPRVSMRVNFMRCHRLPSSSNNC